ELRQIQRRNNALRRLAKETGWNARRRCRLDSKTSIPGCQTKFNMEWQTSLPKRRRRVARSRKGSSIRKPRDLQDGLMLFQRDCLLYPDLCVLQPRYESWDKFI